MKKLRAAACAAMVLSVFACGQELPGEQELVLPPPATFEHDAGAADASVPDAGLRDEAAPDGGADAGLDAGVATCGAGLVGNGGFECLREGWVVVEGTAALISPGEEGQFALSIATDAEGRARVAAAPLRVESQTTLCLAARARGTVANVRLEAWVSPSNQAVTFTAPVSAAWSSVPPSSLAVSAPAGSEVNVMARAIGGKPGQVLELDAFEARPSASGACPP